MSRGKHHECRIRERGSGLVNIMVESVIMLLVLAGASRFMDYATRHNNAMRLIRERDALRVRMQEWVSMPTAVSKSVAANPELKRCLDSSPSGDTDCVATASDKFFPLKMFTAGGALMAGESAAAPQRYSVDGIVCTEVSSACVLEAFAGFRAVCAGGASACDVAESVLIFYTVRSAPGISLAMYGMTSLKTLTNTEDVHDALVMKNPNFSSGGEAAVMYLASTTDSGTVPASCPSEWSEVDYKVASIWKKGSSQNIRTCIRSDKKCGVLYLRAALYVDSNGGLNGGVVGPPPKACPGGWSEADYKFQATGNWEIPDMVRTCYSCG